MAAEAYAREWIDAWNSLNLKRILSHYAEDVVFKSPRVQAAHQRSGGTLGAPDGVLRGTTQLLPYFSEALQKVQGLCLTLDKVTLGCNDKEIALVYRRETGATVVEVFRLNEEHKAAEVQVYYDIVA